MDIIFIIGRILFGLFFLVTGINHFMKLNNMVGYARMKRIIFPTFSVIVSGLMLIVWGIGIIFWTLPIIDTVTSSIILIVFLVLSSLTMHKFWTEEGEAKMADMINFMKNMALIGALLIIISFLI